MKNKKVLALVLAMAMSASVLAGCGNTETGTKESSDVASTSASEKTTEAASSQEEEEVAAEDITFTCYAASVSDQYLLKDNPTWKYLMEELPDFTIELTEIPVAEASEKMNLAMAGGNYPDFFFKASMMNINDYGEDGLLIPLEDMIREYMPNLTALLDERNAWNAITSPDGHIYSLPCITPPYTYAGNGIAWLNESWLENLDMEWPKNMDELYEVLKAFKEQDPNGNGQADEIPMIGAGGVWTSLFYLDGDAKHWDSYIAMMDDDTLQCYFTTEEFKELLAWIAKCYEEGLIHKDVLTLDGNAVKALGVQGDVLGMFYGSSPASAGATEECQPNYTNMPCFVTENATRNNGVAKGGLIITDKCEHPEVLLEFWDYLYSEEGGTISRIGLEGDSYNLNADGTYKFSDKYTQTVQYSLVGSATPALLVTDWIFTGVSSDSSPVALGQKAALEEGGAWKVGTIVPTLLFTPDESERLSVLKTDIWGYTATYVAEVMTGIKDLDTSWDEFQKTIKDMGSEELVEIYQTAYDRDFAK